MNKGKLINKKPFITNITIEVSMKKDIVKPKPKDPPPPPLEP